MVSALSSQECHGLLAVGRDMQMNCRIGSMKRFASQPHITGIVLNQEDIYGRSRRADNVHCDLQAAISLPERPYFDKDVGLAAFLWTHSNELERSAGAMRLGAVRHNDWVHAPTYDVSEARLESSIMDAVDKRLIR